MNVVDRETKFVLIWMLILDAVFLLCCIPFGALHLPMLLGVLLGTSCSIVNFWVLGTVIERAIGNSPGKARSQMAVSYLLRYFFIGLVLVVAVKADYINWIGVVVPLVYPPIIYFIQAAIEQIQKDRKQK